jgi:hypothetical protein
MSSCWNPADFPNLTSQNHQITSSRDTGYNCIAWAAGDVTNWWWPNNIDSYWPAGALNEVTVEAFISAYATLGYSECRHPRYEYGFEKIAIYARHDQGLWVPTHAARQLPDGRWTSKMGNCEDIAHRSINAVNGRGLKGYGAPLRYMKRPSTLHTSGRAFISPSNIGRILRNFFNSLFR